MAWRGDSKTRREGSNKLREAKTRRKHVIQAPAMQMACATTHSAENLLDVGVVVAWHLGCLGMKEKVEYNRGGSLCGGSLLRCRQCHARASLADIIFASIQDLH